MNLFGFKRTDKKKEAAVKHLPSIPSDALEEHHIVLPGIEVKINHTLKLVVWVENAGISDSSALDELEDYLKRQGYFLHCIQVQSPLPERPTT